MTRDKYDEPATRGYVGRKFASLYFLTFACAGIVLMGVAIQPVFAGLYGVGLYCISLFGLCVIAERDWAVKVARWRGYEELVQLGEYDVDDGDSP